MPRITGRVEVLINGQLMLTKTGATTINGIGLSGEGNFELNEVIGDGGIHGFVENPVPATCELTITDRDDISLDTLARIRENGTVIVRAAKGGKVYTMNSATAKRNFGVTSGEGDVAVTFIGNNWVESTEEAI